MLATLIGCAVLSACGGGGGSSASVASPSSVAAPVTASTSTPALPVTGSPVVPAPADTAPAAAAAPADAAGTTPAAPAAPATSVTGEVSATDAAAQAAMVLPPRTGTVTATITGDKITTISIEGSNGPDQTRVPVTFGQPFGAGDVPATMTLTGKLADGTSIPLQVDVKARHADGSLRHAVISAVLPTLSSKSGQVISLYKTTPTVSTSASATSLLATGFSAGVTVVVDGATYSASPDALLRSGAYTSWLAGPIANEWMMTAPLTTASGTVHPHLTARFGVRWYPNAARKARLEVVIENNKTFVPGARNFTYDVAIQIEGKTAFKQNNLTHYHHARWHQLAWWDGAAPNVYLKHNTQYLLASKAVPNYDQTVTISNELLNDYTDPMLAARIGLMKIGPVVGYMPTAGGRVDIGPLPGWTVSYLLSMDKRAKDLMMAAADGSGSFSMHYRDENTGFPLRLDNPVNRTITTHSNFNYRGPLPVPRCANDDWSLCTTPLQADAAHQPSLTYVPYLVTGDYFYLEELQFWAAWNPLGTDSGARGFELGLVRFDQIRAQAWSMRTLGQVAYITPDSHSQKAYWTTQLNNNLDFYNASFVVANPNQLGAYDGKGDGMAESIQSAPWQDDFLTWSFGYISELGFTKAKPILAWKAKYPVGRMTAPGFCYIEGSAYWLSLRAGTTTADPVYSTFAEMYKAHYSVNNGANLQDDGGHVLKHPQGLSYFDQPCGSQAQADWRSATPGADAWQKGRMLGYADSPTGFPANMQPALAVAATSGIPNAALAWSKFNSRAQKPDYSKGAQWAIVPR